MNTLDTLELLPGEEGYGNAILDAWNVKNNLFMNSNFLSIKKRYIDEFNKIPNINQKLKTTKITLVPKKTLHSLIEAYGEIITKTADFIIEISKSQSGLFKNRAIALDNVIQMRGFQELSNLLNSYSKNNSLKYETKTGTFYELGYTSINDLLISFDLAHQVNIKFVATKGKTWHFSFLKGVLVKILLNILAIPLSFICMVGTGSLIPVLTGIRKIYGYWTYAKAIDESITKTTLGELYFRTFDELAMIVKNIANACNHLVDAVEVEPYKDTLDPSLESYFFNQYRDGDVEFNNIFGNIIYNEQNKLWHSKDFFTPSQEYTQTNGKNTWTGTRIPEPIKENYQRLGKLFNTCFSKRHVFEGFLTTVSEAINSAQEKNNSFGTSCNPELIVAGKDRRFTIQSIDFCHPKTTNMDSIIVTMTFNNRVFYAIFNEKLQMYSYIPKDPKIISSYPIKEMLTDINHTQEFNQLNFALGMEGFKSSNSGMHQKFNEELTSVIEGEYDSEDTDVVVNPVDDQVADVDIRIDLTPNREQQLLKSINYSCKYELDCYGIEGLNHKVTSNNHNFEVMFNDLYNNLSKTTKYFNNTPKELFDNLVLQYNTDIENKESFLEAIKDSSTTVFRSFNTLKQLAESSDIITQKIHNTKPKTYINKLIPSTDANFTSKEDIQFLANELNKTKLNVNIPQIKFYTTKIMNKLNSKKYTSDKYLYVSNVLNEMNNSLVTLANVLSQGERFISGISIYANS